MSIFVADPRILNETKAVAKAFPVDPGDNTTGVTFEDDGFADRARETDVNAHDAAFRRAHTLLRIRLSSGGSDVSIWSRFGLDLV